MMSTTQKNTSTRALILAAGEGTRLRPITFDRPKPMVPINGRPLLDYIVGWLRDSGIRDIAINLHYKPEVIVDHFGDGAAHQINLHYSHEEKILGTAGAARKIKSWVGNDSLLVVYGDVLTDLDIRQLLTQHSNNLARDESTVATIALYHVPNPTEVGLVGMDETGRVNRFLEKPKPEEVFTDLANAGVCVIEPSAIDMIPENSFYDFGLHLFPKSLEAQLGIYGWVIPSDTYLLDIGSLEKYAQAQRDWRERAQIRSAVPIDELNV